MGRLWGGFGEALGRLWEALGRLCGGKMESDWAAAVEALPSEGARRKEKRERRKRTKKKKYIKILGVSMTPDKPALLADVSSSSSK